MEHQSNIWMKQVGARMQEDAPKRIRCVDMQGSESRQKHIDQFEALSGSIGRISLRP